MGAANIRVHVGDCHGIFESFDRLSDQDLDALDQTTAYVEVVDMQWRRRGYLTRLMTSVLEQIIAHDLTDRERNYFRLNQKRYMQ